MTSSLRESILAALVEPRTRDELAAITATAKPAVCEAVSILIERGAVREVGPGPIHRLELVTAATRGTLATWLALGPADRELMLESSEAVARSYVADLEAARGGDRRPINVHACDVLGIAVALIIAREERAAAAELLDRVRTIADEVFGPFPVQSPLEAVNAIDAGARDQYARIEQLERQRRGPPGTYSTTYRVGDLEITATAPATRAIELSAQRAALAFACDQLGRIVLLHEAVHVEPAPDASKEI
jgi:hypothetical protein